MRTTSHISAVALAAALLMTPQVSMSQLLDGGGDAGVSVDAGVDVGGDSGGSVDADVSVGVGSGSDDSLVDLDVNSGGDADSDGGSLTLDGDVLGTDTLDATVTSGNEQPTEVDVEVLGGGTTEPSTGLITGDVRISALGETARADALISLIEDPNLAELDLDAAIDDTRVAIVAAADLLSEDALADVQAAIEIGGAGREELLAALSSSSELTAILETEGVDLADVVAVQIGADGATEVIVLGGAVQVAALGENGNLADLTADELAALDIDLLSDEELAEIKLALLPEEEQRLDAVLRILGTDTEPGAVEDVEIIDLDVLLGEQSLADVRAFLSSDGNATELTLDAQLLGLLEKEGVSPDAVAAIRFGDNQSARVFIGGSLSESVASLQVGRASSDEGGSDGAGADGDTDETGAGTVDEDDASDDTAAAPPAELEGNAPVSAEVALPITEVGCTAGVSALASGADAPAAAVASADNLEVVLVGGCSQPVEADNAERIQAAVEANPEISLEAMDLTVDDIIGATIDGDTVILYLYPAGS